MFSFRKGAHQGSVIIPLLFSILLEVRLRDFHTGCPWELLKCNDPCALTLISGASDAMVDNRKPWATSKVSTL